MSTTQVNTEQSTEQDSESGIIPLNLINAQFQSAAKRSRKESEEYGDGEDEFPSLKMEMEISEQIMPSFENGDLPLPTDMEFLEGVGFRIVYNQNRMILTRKCPNDNPNKWTLSWYPTGYLDCNQLKEFTFPDDLKSIFQH